jgi:hypothetical protein
MKNRIGGTCSTDGKHEEFVNNELVDLRADERIILKWIPRKQGTRVLLEFICLRWGQMKSRILFIPAERLSAYQEARSMEWVRFKDLRTQCRTQISCFRNVESDSAKS